jgi:hypothetical protein
MQCDNWMIADASIAPAARSWLAVHESSARRSEARRKENAACWPGNWMEAPMLQRRSSKLKPPLTTMMPEQHLHSATLVTPISGVSV